LAGFIIKLGWHNNGHIWLSIASLRFGWRRVNIIFDRLIQLYNEFVKRPRSMFEKYGTLGWPENNIKEKLKY